MRLSNYLQSKFLSFYQFAKSFNSDSFDYEEMNNTDFVFMRWKVMKFSIASGLISEILFLASF